MNIRKRLLLLSTLIFGLVFTISALIVYSFFMRSSEMIIYNELEHTSLLTAYFYLEEDELPAREHNKIKEEFFENIKETKVKLYDDFNEFTYGDSATGKSAVLTHSVIDQVREKGKIRFKKGSTYFFGRHYPDNQGDFVVFAFSNNDFFKSQSNQLIFLLVGSLFSGLLLILLLSFYLSKTAYKPVRDIVEQIDQIDLKSLKPSPLQVPETKDEVQNLAVRFNSLFNRISDNFRVQKNFINYLSHEIKTPLAAISGNLEVFAQKDRKPEEYRMVTKKSLQNVHDIKNLLTNLLLLSDLQKEPGIQNRFRLDETIWKVLDKIYLKYPGAKNQIKIKIEVEDFELLVIESNESQLETALYNLIENAVKYSLQKPIAIVLSRADDKLQMVIRDSGMGIPEEELKEIDHPFHRGSNAGEIKGSGIGLSFASLIFDQNNIAFHIASEIDKGTVVTLGF